MATKVKKAYQVSDDNGGTVEVQAHSQDQAEAIARLRRWLKPGDKVWTVMRHRSASGMSRVIDIVRIETRTGGEEMVSTYGYNAALALGWRYSLEKEGVKVQGCGMDMGFHMVYELSHVLFGDGYALKQGWI